MGRTFIFFWRKERLEEIIMYLYAIENNLAKYKKKKLDAAKRI